MLMHPGIQYHIAFTGIRYAQTHCFVACILFATRQLGGEQYLMVTEVLDGL